VDNLRDLKKDWYKKLAEEGFEDIEYFDRDMNPKEWLKGPGNVYSDSGETPADKDALLDKTLTLDYYLAAASFLHTGKFDNDTEEFIWKAHSEGESLRKIAAKVGFSHPKVLRMVDKYRLRFFNIIKEKKK